MKQRLFTLLAVLAVSTGCTGPKYEPPPKRHGPEYLFLGEPADKPIGFDIVGTWSAWRFGTPENPGKLGRWEAKWCLKKTGPNEWEDENRQGKFRLTDGVPQMLIWHRPDRTWYFSINKHHFGFFEQMTGADGELYSAVRTEGGENP